MRKSRLEALQDALTEERHRKSARITTLQHAISEERKQERNRKAAARLLPANLQKARKELADLVASIEARRQGDREALKAARYGVTKIKRRIAAAIRDGLLPDPGVEEDDAADHGRGAGDPAASATPPNPAHPPTAHIAEDTATGGLLVRTSRPADGFPAAARALGADWSRIDGHWRFPASRRTEALELVAGHYEVMKG
ncbi:MAG: hypothetical protein OXQ29_14745 [Rhodospirillaceae bacterium]|nr:hypothetical protein [Rhodospirillaceae bacterium]